MAMGSSRVTLPADICKKPEGKTSPSLEMNITPLPSRMPATWPRPLFQTWHATYSQPFATSTGWTVAHPTSVFQNQSVVNGVALALHASMCGRYHSARPACVGGSPGNPETPYAPSEMKQTGSGHSA